MKKIIFIYFLLFSFSLDAQKIDLLILDGVRYKGKLINYSKFDIRDKDSGQLSFVINKFNDTLKIDVDRNIKLKINKFSEYYNFTKKTWNNIELSGRGIFISKGLVNKKLYNFGIGSGIYTIDRINFIPIYLKNFYDFYPINRKSTFKLFAENNIGFSISKDLGIEDYIEIEGGFYWNPSLGIKKSVGKTHISLKLGYLLQNYFSEHNNWWGFWGPIDMLLPGQNLSDDIIRRDGSFNRMTLSFSVFF
tara:strand:- start:161 stop:904 length:744 start_codon:yes stop_codon:yes gene_type:complete